MFVGTTMGGLALLMGALAWMTLSLDGEKKAPPERVSPPSHTELHKTTTGYSGHSRGLAVQVHSGARSLGQRCAFALRLPPLLYLRKAPRSLDGGARLRWDRLDLPHWGGTYYIREGALHGESDLKTLPQKLDHISALLLQAEAPTSALIEALDWDLGGLQDVSRPGLLARRGTYRGREMLLEVKDPAAVFRLEHGLNFHPEFRLGVGISSTHQTGNPVLDVVLGCQSPESTDLDTLQGKAEALLSFLHPRPRARLNGAHLLFYSEGSLEQVVREVDRAFAFLARLEGAEY